MLRYIHQFVQSFLKEASKSRPKSRSRSSVDLVKDKSKVKPEILAIDYNEGPEADRTKEILELKRTYSLLMRKFVNPNLDLMSNTRTSNNANNLNLKGKQEIIRSVLSKIFYERSEQKKQLEDSSKDTEENENVVQEESVGWSGQRTSKLAATPMVETTSKLKNIASASASFLEDQEKPTRKHIRQTDKSLKHRPTATLKEQSVKPKQNISKKSKYIVGFSFTNPESTGNVEKEKSLVGTKKQRETVKEYKESETFPRKRGMNLIRGNLQFSKNKDHKRFEGNGKSANYYRDRENLTQYNQKENMNIIRTITKLDKNKEAKSNKQPVKEKENDTVNIIKNTELDENKETHEEKVGSGLSKKKELPKSNILERKKEQIAQYPVNPEELLTDTFSNGLKILPDINKDINTSEKVENTLNVKVELSKINDNTSGEKSNDIDMIVEDKLTKPNNEEETIIDREQNQKCINKSEIKVSDYKDQSHPLEIDQAMKRNEELNKETLDEKSKFSEDTYWSLLSNTLQKTTDNAQKLINNLEINSWKTKTIETTQTMAKNLTGIDLNKKQNVIEITDEISKKDEKTFLNGSDDIKNKTYGNFDQKEANIINTLDIKDTRYEENENENNLSTKTKDIHFSNDNSKVSETKVKVNKLIKSKSTDLRSKNGKKVMLNPIKSPYHNIKQNESKNNMMRTEDKELNKREVKSKEAILNSKTTSHMSEDLKTSQTEIQKEEEIEGNDTVKYVIPTENNKIKKLLRKFKKLEKRKSKENVNNFQRKYSKNLNEGKLKKTSLQKFKLDKEKPLVHKERTATRTKSDKHVVDNPLDSDIPVKGVSYFSPVDINKNTLGRSRSDMILNKNKSLGTQKKALDNPAEGVNVNRVDSNIFPTNYKTLSELEHTTDTNEPYSSKLARQSFKSAEQHTPNHKTNKVLTEFDLSKSRKLHSRKEFCKPNKLQMYGARRSIYTLSNPKPSDNVFESSFGEDVTEPNMASGSLICISDLIQVRKLHTLGSRGRTKQVSWKKRIERRKRNTVINVNRKAKAENAEIAKKCVTEECVGETQPSPSEVASLSTTTNQQVNTTDNDNKCSLKSTTIQTEGMNLKKSETGLNLELQNAQSSQQNETIINSPKWMSREDRLKMWKLEVESDCVEENRNDLVKETGADLECNPSSTQTKSDKVGKNNGTIEKDKEEKDIKVERVTLVYNEKCNNTSTNNIRFSNNRKEKNNLYNNEQNSTIYGDKDRKINSEPESKISKDSVKGSLLQTNKILSDQTKNKNNNVTDKKAFTNELDESRKKEDSNNKIKEFEFKLRALETKVKALEFKSIEPKSSEPLLKNDLNNMKKCIENHNISLKNITVSKENKTNPLPEEDRESKNKTTDISFSIKNDSKTIKKDQSEIMKEHLSQKVKSLELKIKSLESQVQNLKDEPFNSSIKNKDVDSKSFEESKSKNSTAVKSSLNISTGKVVNRSNQLHIDKTNSLNTQNKKDLEVYISVKNKDLNKKPIEESKSQNILVAKSALNISTCKPVDRKDNFQKDKTNCLNMQNKNNMEAHSSIKIKDQDNKSFEESKSQKLTLAKLALNINTGKFVDKKNNLHNDKTNNLNIQNKNNAEAYSSIKNKALDNTTFEESKSRNLTIAKSTLNTSKQVDQKNNLEDKTNNSNIQNKVGMETHSSNKNKDLGNKPLEEIKSQKLTVKQSALNTSTMNTDKNVDGKHHLHKDKTNNLNIQNKNNMEAHSSIKNKDLHNKSFEESKSQKLTITKSALNIISTSQLVDRKNHFHKDKINYFNIQNNNVEARKREKTTNIIVNVKPEIHAKHDLTPEKNKNEDHIKDTKNNNFSENSDKESDLVPPKSTTAKELKLKKVQVLKPVGKILKPKSQPEPIRSSGISESKKVISYGTKWDDRQQIKCSRENTVHTPKTTVLQGKGKTTSQINNGDKVVQKQIKNNMRPKMQGTSVLNKQKSVNVKTFEKNMSSHSTDVNSNTLTEKGSSKTALKTNIAPLKCSDSSDTPEQKNMKEGQQNDEMGNSKKTEMTGNSMKVKKVSKKSVLFSISKRGFFRRKPFQGSKKGLVYLDSGSHVKAKPNTLHNGLLNSSRLLKSGDSEQGSRVKNVKGKINASSEIRTSPISKRDSPPELAKKLSKALTLLKTPPNKQDLKGSKVESQRDLDSTGPLKSENKTPVKSKRSIRKRGNKNFNSFDYYKPQRRTYVLTHPIEKEKSSLKVQSKNENILDKFYPKYPSQNSSSDCVFSFKKNKRGRGVYEFQKEHYKYLNTLMSQKIPISVFKAVQK